MLWDSVKCKEGYTKYKVNLEVELRVSINSSMSAAAFLGIAHSHAGG